MKESLLAINGTLMRGLKLNSNLTDIGGKFVATASTDNHYRLWSIDDCYPAMLRTRATAASVALEIWRLPDAALVTLLNKEPLGLTVGRVKLNDGTTVLGILAEPWLVEGELEISHFGGWREYLAHSKVHK